MPPTQSPTAKSPGMTSPNTSMTSQSSETLNPPAGKLTPTTIGDAHSGGCEMPSRAAPNTTRPKAGSRSVPEATVAFHPATVAASAAGGQPISSASSPGPAALTAGSGICSTRSRLARCTLSSKT